MYFIAGVCVQCALVIALRYNPNWECPYFLVWIIKVNESVTGYISVIIQHPCQNAIDYDGVGEKNTELGEKHETVDSIRFLEERLSQQIESSNLKRRYLAEHLSIAADNCLRLIIPVWYLIYLSQVIPTEIYNRQAYS
jgi:hypothetical protein